MDLSGVVCSAFALVVLGGMGALVYLFALAMNRTGRLNQAFRLATVAMNGHFVPGGVWKKPRATMRYGSTAARLRIVRFAGNDCTELTINWPNAALRFEILSRRDEEHFRKKDWTSLEFGEQRLDENLYLRAEKPEAMKVLLSDGVKWQIERLLLFLPHQNLYCGSLRRELVLRKSGVIKNGQELVQLIRFGLELYDQLQLTQVDGIDFVESAEATLLEQIDCPICGEPIESQLVTCVSCKTPHHRDCWEYNGRCATFACGQEVFATPAVAHPVQDRDEAEA